MTSKLKTLVASTSVMALLASGAPAMAAGTVAGTDIANTVTITYDVGGITQTPPAVTGDTFKVDRKIIFDIYTTDAVSTFVTPNTNDQIVSFELENTSNDTLDFDLTVSNAANGFSTTNSDAGVDSYDALNLEYCIDYDKSGTCNGSEVWGTTANVDDLAPDASVFVLVRGDFPSSAPNAAVSAVSVTAVGLTSAGAALTDDSGAADIAGTVQNVFADTDENNSETADDNYVVRAAVLAVAKLSRVVSDPVSGTTNPKAIPGAIVEYCITVNNSGSAAASNVAITDDLAQVAAGAQYYATYVPQNGGTSVTSGVCSTDGADDATAYDGGTNTISSVLSSVPAGELRTLIFQVEIK